MMHWGYGSGWGYLLMAVSMVALWSLIIGAIVLVARAAVGTSTPAPQSVADPQRILAERFARGEIDESEYRNRLASLRGNDRRPAR